ncbi:MAG: hypothetical protein IH977_04290 [Nitrospinae bacterium]|nr:hypothetical protein [Nitrospinota bacterium]
MLDTLSKPDVSPGGGRPPHRGMVGDSRPCPVCHQPLTGKNTQQCCSGKCRARFNRRKRAQVQVERQAHRDAAVRIHLKAALTLLEDSP